ncbi:unnamed protein product [Caenorhabditis bovis]|uniref:polyribonucleotide nucleotidyltransferase n=1 Tax=Caenorhabditis bovis TaxID=2654633 RepID=A0A8S1EL23_9PELO|nr:unnamed protein product [Caenorhabditis bovis]
MKTSAIIPQLKLPCRFISGVRKTNKESYAKCDIGESPLELKTGHLARFASAAVVASTGDNAIMATCVQGKRQGDGNGTPLTVEYRPSAAAVGRIPTNFLRRELSQSENEILLSRAIDRSLRPLIPAYSYETQIICKPLALDEDGDQLMLGINAASTALHVSEVPFDGPMAALRIVMDPQGNIHVNPSSEKTKNAILNLIVSMKSSEKTVMIEMDANEVSLENIEQAMDVAFRDVEKVLNAMDLMKSNVQNDKIEIVPPNHDKLMEIIEGLARERIYYVMTDSTHDKVSRDNEIKNILDDILKSNVLADFEYLNVANCFYSLVKNVLRNSVLTSGIRCDGRRIDEFRPISIQIDMYKKLHGCSLFQRGQTQVMSTVTFDSPTAAFHPDSVAQLLGSQRKKSFMLHYEFPSYATNEIGASRSANRREIGHGALAEKALKDLVPNDFPYAVRLACQVLESNGSSSMASVCGGSLALFDAGVPMKNAAAGVAIGLVTDENRPESNYKVLTDILGIEDYAGDMDFKIAGTKTGFTAAQMDVKIGGLTRKQLRESLEAGRAGIDHVLKKMNVMRDRPREQFKSSVPIIESMRIEPHKRAILFRNNGFNCKQIEADTNVKIMAEDEHTISMLAPTKEKLQNAKDLMKTLMEDNEKLDYTFGSILSAEIVEIIERGIYVTLPGSLKRVFIPNNHLSLTPIRHSEVLGLKVGEKIAVHWFGRDEQTGNIRLSRKTLAGSSPKMVNSRK